MQQRIHSSFRPRARQEGFQAEGPGIQNNLVTDALGKSTCGGWADMHAQQYVAEQPATVQRACLGSEDCLSLWDLGQLTSFSCASVSLPAPTRLL